VAQLEELIPGREDVAALLDDINLRARAVNVEVTALDLEPPELGVFYDKQSYNMAVVGEYHAVGRFLTEIASLPRIVTTVQLDLQLFTSPDIYPELDSPVLATFRIETYVLPDPSAPPPAQVPGG